MNGTRFDEWERQAEAWFSDAIGEPPEPLTTSDTLRLVRACKRAYAIEESVTQGQERELREGYREMLREALL